MDSKAYIWKVSMAKYAPIDDISQIDMELVEEFVRDAMGYVPTDEEIEEDKKKAIASRTNEFVNIMRHRRRVKKAKKRERESKSKN